jgi:hypothetical protein
MSKQQVLPVGQDDKVFGVLEMFGWPIHDGFIVVGGERGFFPTHGPKAARAWATLGFVPAWANKQVCIPVCAKARMHGYADWLSWNDRLTFYRVRIFSSGISPKCLTFEVRTSKP